MLTTLRVLTHVGGAAILCLSFSRASSDPLVAASNDGDVNCVVSSAIKVAFEVFSLIVEAVICSSFEFSEADATALGSISDLGLSISAGWFDVLTAFSEILDEIELCCSE